MPRFFDTRKGEGAKLGFDALAIVGDEGIRDVQEGSGFYLGDVVGAEIAVPEDAEHSVVLFGFSADGFAEGF